MTVRCVMFRPGMTAAAALVLGATLLSGCGGGAPAQQSGGGPPAAPEVQVSHPVVDEVTDFQDFPGRLAAITSVEVRARVTGYLTKIHFRDGAEVKKGELLFEIDPRPYEAELARAEGSVVQSEGRLTRLNSEFDRAKNLITKNAISREDLDRITSERIEAQGALAVSKAARDLAKLNLDFTKVTAPIDGQLGNRMLDEGNLVKADDTPVTVIVSTNPIYVFFDLDERTLLRLKRLLAEKKLVWNDKKGLKVLMGLADEEGYPHEGVVNFADNRVDADSGTWRLRGVFDNKEELLAPGLFVRIRLPIGEPTKSILIAEEALNTDQGQKFVFTVNGENKVEYRAIKVGALHKGLRVVLEGLSTSDKVIVSGLQRARPGIEVKAELVPMPGTKEAAEAAAKAAADKAKAAEKPDGSKPEEKKE